MAGQIKSMIDTIISQRARGNPTIAFTTSTKILLKGINPAQFDHSSPDDPVIISALVTIANELGIRLSSQ